MNRATPRRGRRFESPPRRIRPNLTASFDFDELKAVVEATDEWIEDNGSLYNAALPDGNFKSDATLAQKTILFAYVAFKRAGLI